MAGTDAESAAKGLWLNTREAPGCSPPEGGVPDRFYRDSRLWPSRILWGRMSPGAAGPLRRVAWDASAGERVDAATCPARSLAADWRAGMDTRC